MKWIAIVATSYCLSGTMADGSSTRAGSAANNWYPLGTKITISPPFLGRRRWVIRDRIGYGTQLDLWAPSCGQSIQFGRRTIKFRVGWAKKKKYRVIHERIRVGTPPTWGTYAYIPWSRFGLGGWARRYATTSP